MAGMIHDLYRYFVDVLLPQFVIKQIKKQTNHNIQKPRWLSAICLLFGYEIRSVQRLVGWFIHLLNLFGT